MKAQPKSKINRRVIYLGVVALLLCGIVTLLVINRDPLHNALTASGNKSQATAKKIGERFYQDFYYGLVTNGKTDNEKVQLLQDNRLTMAVSEIAGIAELKVDDLWAELQKDNKYDWQASKIIITPQSPYGSGDYKIEVQLIDR